MGERIQTIKNLNCVVLVRGLACVWFCCVKLSHFPLSLALLVLCTCISAFVCCMQVCLWSLIYICLAEPSEWRHWLRKTEQLRGGVRSILWWYGGRICGGRCDREWACTLTHARSFLIMYSMARRACTPSRSSERVGQSSYGRQRWRCCGGGSGQTWPHASGPSQGSWWACRCRGPRRCRHILCDRPKHGLAFTPAAHLQAPSQETQGSVGFGAGVVNVLPPRQVGMQGDWPRSRYLVEDTRSSVQVQVHVGSSRFR